MTGQVVPSSQRKLRYVMIKQHNTCTFSMEGEYYTTQPIHAALGRKTQQWIETNIA